MNRQIEGEVRIEPVGGRGDRDRDAGIYLAQPMSRTDGRHIVRERSKKPLSLFAVAAIQFQFSQGMRCNTSAARHEARGRRERKGGGYERDASRSLAEEGVKHHSSVSLPYRGEACHG